MVQAKMMQIHSSDPTLAPILKIKTILIVEDERIIAEEIRMNVEGFGYVVASISATGEDAIYQCDKHKPDIILMDIKLQSAMTGIDAAKIITEKFQVPIIFVSANADEATLSKALQANPYGFLVKPFEEIDLRTALETAFHKATIVSDLKKSENRFRQLIKENTDGMIVVNDENIICFLNEAAEKLLGKNKTELVGEQVGFLVSQNKISELNIVTKEGEIRTVEMSVVETEWEKSKAYLASLRDITTRKRSEEKLSEANLELKTLMEELVNGLMRTVEVRDPYTAGHQKRVASLATAIAEELELPTKRIEGVRIAALIHDIGKINIPTDIMIKPGKISELEFDLIKSHSQAGYDIVKTIKFPWPIAKAILQHHEKLDGSSYPNGEQGDTIILEAKIICVADVVEAMCSHRPYRPALGKKRALEEITTKRNTLYDGKVVDACIKVMNESKFNFN